MSDFDAESSATESSPAYQIQARVAWILMAIVAVIAMLPVLGFVSWIIAGPMMLVAFIMTIIVFSKGGVRQGLALLGCQLIVMPVLIIFGPFISSLIGVGGGIATVAAVTSPSASDTAEASYSNASPDVVNETSADSTADVSPPASSTELPPALEQLKQKVFPQQALLHKFKSEGIAREAGSGYLQTDEKADLSVRRLVQQENLHREEAFRQIAEMTKKTVEEVAAEFARMAGGAALQ